jgi:Acetyltransferase (GNAT) family.
VNIRPFQEADAATVAHLVTQSVRGQWTYRPAQFRVSADPQRRRLVAERGGEVIASVHCSPFGAGAPDALRLDFAGEGASFSPLYLALLADLPTGFSRLLGVTREDWPEQMHFFLAAGFRNAWQSWGAQLDLTAWDAGRFQPLEERLFLQGLEAERYDVDGSDWDAFYALHRQGEADMPRNPVTTPDPLTSADLHDTLRREEAAFVLRLNGQIVALTRLTLGEHKGRPGEVESEFTVTAPAWRGRGLATVLKAHALTWAQEAVYRHAGTGGTVLNLSMLRVNARLGYVTEPMWVIWERRL